MPLYSYTAIDAEGRRFSDTKAAQNPGVLESLLHEQGSWLLKSRVASAKTDSVKSKRVSKNIKVKRWELINFYTQLSLLLRAGVTLPSALAKLGQDLSEEKLGAVITRLAEDVNSGTPLPKAMSHFARCFPPQTQALIEAGEASGKLPECLKSLADNLEWLDGLISNARQALIYPAAVSVAAMALVTMLFVVVVPRFSALFTELSVEMPLITQIVIMVSNFFVSTWYIWLAAIIFIPFLSALAKRVYGIRVAKDKFLLNLPFFGEITRSLALSQFSVTLSMLIQSGIPLARGLSLSAKQSSNSLLKIAVEASRKAVMEGRSMSSELQKHSIFTQTFVTMAQTGEKSGQLDAALDQVSDYYNTIVPRKIKAFFGVFEPTIIITLTSVVGIVALALVLPIMSLWNVG